MTNQASVAHADTKVNANADAVEAEAKAKANEPSMAEKLAYIEACIAGAIELKDYANAGKLAGEASKLQKAEAEAEHAVAEFKLFNVGDKLAKIVRKAVADTLSEDELALAEGVWITWDTATPLAELSVKLLRPKRVATEQQLKERADALNGPATAKLLRAYGNEGSLFNELGLTYNQLYAQKNELATSKAGNFVHFKIREPLLKMWMADGEPNLA